MPQIAYRVEDVPPRALAACTPVPTRTPTAATWGVVHTVGAPGTTRIDSPHPQSTKGFGALGVPNSTVPADDPQPSGHSPDYFLPALYITQPTPQGTVHRSTNEIPIPAISSHQPYAPFSASAPGKAINPTVLQRVRTRVASGFATAWPKVAPIFPIFPSDGTGSNQAGS